MRIFFSLLLCSLGVYHPALCQEAVFFYTPDSSSIRAEIFLKNAEFPFIIIYRDNQKPAYFTDFGRKIRNLNYNCLVVNLHAGNSMKSKADIEAAILYSHTINEKPVILCGSTYSASLCLITAVGNNAVKAVIAMSPGEFFLPFTSLSEEVSKLKQPVFVSTSTPEFPYVQKIMAQIPEEQITLFKPEKRKGNSQGIEAFFSQDATADEYWFALMLFFKKVESRLH